MAMDQVGIAEDLFKKLEEEVNGENLRSYLELATIEELKTNFGSDEKARKYINMKTNREIYTTEAGLKEAAGHRMKDIYYSIPEPTRYYGSPADRAKVANYEELLESNTKKNKITRSTVNKVEVAVDSAGKYVWWEGKRKNKYSSTFLRKRLTNSSIDYVLLELDEIEKLKKSSFDIDYYLTVNAKPDIPAGKENNAQCIIYYPYFNKVECDPSAVYNYYTRPIIQSLLTRGIAKDIKSGTEREALKYGYTAANIKSRSNGRLALYLMGKSILCEKFEKYASILNELCWTGDKFNNLTPCSLFPGAVFDTNNNESWNSLSSRLDFKAQPIGYKLMKYFQKSGEDFNSLDLCLISKLIDYIRGYHKRLTDAISALGYSALTQNSDFKFETQQVKKASDSYSSVIARSTKSKVTYSSDYVKILKKPSVGIEIELGTMQSILTNFASAHDGIKMESICAVLYYYHHPFGKFYRSIHPIRILTDQNGYLYNISSITTSPETTIRMTKVKSNGDIIAHEEVPFVRNAKNMAEIYTNCVMGNKDPLIMPSLFTMCVIALAKSRSKRYPGFIFSSKIKNIIPQIQGDVITKITSYIQFLSIHENVVMNPLLASQNILEPYLAVSKLNTYFA